MTKQIVIFNAEQCFEWQKNVIQSNGKKLIENKKWLKGKKNQSCQGYNL